MGRTTYRGLDGRHRDELGTLSLVQMRSAELSWQCGEDWEGSDRCERDLGRANRPFAAWKGRLCEIKMLPQNPGREPAVA